MILWIIEINIKKQTSLKMYQVKHQFDNNEYTCDLHLKVDWTKYTAIKRAHVYYVH